MGLKLGGGARACHQFTVETLGYQSYTPAPVLLARGCNPGTQGILGLNDDSP